MGLFVNIPDLLMEIKTSRPPEKLAELVTPLQSRLDLKLIESSHDGGSSLSSQASPTPEGWWVKHMVAVVVALVGSAAVGLQLMRAALTDYDLQILSPTAENTLFESDADRVQVNWLLKPDDTLFRGRDYHSEASVVLLRNGAPVKELPPQRPPAVLDVSPGRYVVEIRPSKEADPKRFSLLVR